MANRITDSRKWNDGWFMNLDPSYKLMWLYLLDMCNHAGIYKVNRKLEECCLGFPINNDPDVFQDRVVSLGDEKWFIPKFVEFQYKVLSLDNLDPTNRVHKSVLDILSKEGAYKKKEGAKNILQGCKDKNKDKVKDKDIITPPLNDEQRETVHKDAQKLVKELSEKKRIK